MNYFPTIKFTSLSIYKLTLLFLLTFSVGLAFADTRLIIKYRSQASKELAARALTNKTHRLNLKNKSIFQALELKTTRVLPTQAEVLISPDNLTKEGLKEVLVSLNQDSNIEYAEEDRKMYPQATPAYNPYQFDMLNSSSVPGSDSWGGQYDKVFYGDNFYNAWNYLNQQNETPGSSVIVAVIDTGYIPHPNFISNLVELSSGSSNYGYDFISDCRLAGTCPAAQANNINRAPQANALDLGDFITSSDAAISFFNGCAVVNSSWHGTHVTGSIIGQGYSSGTGVLGGAYGAQVLPVRVLGKCGGYSSDIINGMLWAAGIHVDGVADNPTPAKVLNLSLGGSGACGSAYQAAINQVVDRGAVVVVAAGNSAQDITDASPANCQNVISVASIGPTRKLAYYSNYGNVTIAANGGDYKLSPSPYPSMILSTLSNLPQTFESSNNNQYVYAWYQGTSMAAPHVSAAVTVLFAESSNLSLTNLKEVLQNSAASLSNSCLADGTSCISAGRLDVYAALYYLIHLNHLNLTSSLSNLIFDGNNTILSLEFTNPNSSAIDIGLSTIENNANRFSFLENTCQNTNLASNNKCTIKLKYTAAGVGEVINTSLKLYNAFSRQIASILITASSYENSLNSNLEQIILDQTNQFQKQVVFINNTNNIVPITSYVINYTNAQNFITVSNNTCINSLNPGESCSLLMKFSGQASGNYQANLTFYNNNQILISLPILVSIPIASLSVESGNSIESIINFNPEKTTQDVRFINNSAYPISIKQVAIINIRKTTSYNKISSKLLTDYNPFSIINNTCQGVISVGESCNVTISSSLGNNDFYQANLLIYNDQDEVISNLTLKANASNQPGEDKAESSTLSSNNSGGGRSFGGGCTSTVNGGDMSMSLLFFSILLMGLFSKMVYSN